MRRLFLLCLMLSTGCVVTTRGGSEIYLLTPSGVDVHMFNRCQNGIGIAHTSNGRRQEVPVGSPKPVYVHPTMAGDQYVAITFDVMKDGVVLGTTSYSFYVGQGAPRTVQWVIGGNSGGGGGNIVYSYVYDREGRRIC